MKEDHLQDDASRLRKEVHAILCNKLALAKTVISLINQREFNETNLTDAENVIDESIRLVDGKFIEFLVKYSKRKRRVP